MEGFLQAGNEENSSGVHLVFASNGKAGFRLAMVSIPLNVTWLIYELCSDLASDQFFTWGQTSCSPGIFQPKSYTRSSKAMSKKTHDI